MYIERQQLVEELRLRKLIQQAISIVESKKTITEDDQYDPNGLPKDFTDKFHDEEDNEAC